jgi:hypothetical protein
VGYALVWAHLSVATSPHCPCDTVRMAPCLSLLSHRCQPTCQQPSFPQSPTRCSPRTCYHESRRAMPQQVPHSIAAPSVCTSSASAQLLPTRRLAATAPHHWPQQRHTPCLERIRSIWTSLPHRSAHLFTLLPTPTTWRPTSTAVLLSYWPPQRCLLDAAHRTLDQLCPNHPIQAHHI